MIVRSTQRSSCGGSHSLVRFVLCLGSVRPRRFLAPTDSAQVMSVKTTKGAAPIHATGKAWVNQTAM